MKKKILSAILAIAICFSAFSFTAFADEATGLKNKADLEAYLKTFSDTFLKTDVFGYGTNSYEVFNRAYAHAETVIASSDSSAELFNAAYYMVKGAYDNLLKKTKPDLTALLAQHRALYNTNNELNGDGDTKYTDGSWAEFATAFDNAEYNTFDDSNTITDLWYALDHEFNTLSAKATITKTQMAALIRQADSVYLKRNLFTDERQGTSTVVLRTAGGGGGSQLPLTWGSLWDVANGIELLSYKKGLYLRVGDNDYTGFDPAYTSLVLNYETFSNYHSSSTSNEGIVGAYNNATVMVAAVNGFVGDNTGSASASNFQTAINNVQSKLVNLENYAAGSTASPSSLGIVSANPRLGMGALSKLYDTLAITADWKDASGTTNGALIYAGTTFSIIYNSKTNAYIRHETGANGTFNTSADEARFVVNKGTAPDLKKYVAVNVVGTVAPSDNKIEAGELNIALPGNASYNNDVTTLTLSTLYIDAYAIIASPSADLDTTVSTKFGSAYEDLDGTAVDLNAAAKRAQIFRIFKYTLDNINAGGRDLKTKAELQNLVNASYECDETMLASAAGLLSDVVTARKDALENLKKVYDRTQIADKDDQAEYYVSWDALNNAVNAFKDYMKNKPVSVAEVLALMADGAKTDAEATIALVQAVAYELIKTDDGDVWDASAAIILTGRLDSRSGQATNPSYKAYVALKDSLGIVSAYAKGDVNGDTHITTADAIEILKYIVDLDSVIKDNAKAFAAASITGDAPSSADALAILKHIAEIELIK